MLPSPWAPARSASSCLKSSPSQTYTGFPQDGSIPPTRRLFSLLRVRVWLEYSGTACMWLLLGLDGRVWKLEPMGRGRWGGGIFSSEELFIPLSWERLFSKYVPFHAGKAHQKLNCKCEWLRAEKQSKNEPTLSAWISILFTVRLLIQE